MSQSPYAIPEEELVGRVRVAAEERVEVQAEPEQPRPDWSPDPVRYGDATGADTDGE